MNRTIINEALRNEEKAAMKKVKDSEIFASSAFHEYVQSMARTVTGVQNISCTLLHDKNGAIASTNGKNITLNTKNSISSFYKARADRVLSMLGIVFHECAHIIYLDFETNKKGMDELKNGRLFGEVPVPANDDEKGNLDTLYQMLTDEKQRQILSKIYGDLSNIVADSHDEACICRDGGILITQGITLSEASLRAQAPTFEKMLRENREPLSIMYSLMLQYARFGLVLMEKDEEDESEYMQALYNMMPHLERARTTDNMEQRYGQFNKCILYLLPYIEAALDNHNSNSGQSNSEQSNEQGQGGNSQGEQQSSSGSSPGPSDESIAAVMQQLGKSSESLQSTAPQNCTSSAQESPGTDSSSSNSQQQQPGDKSKAQNVVEQLLAQIKTEIAKQKAAQKVDKSIVQETNVIIQQIDMNDGHKGRKARVIQHQKANDDEVNNYLSIHQEIADISKNLQRRILNVLRQYSDDGIVKRLGFGKQVAANHVYRPDAHFFQKRKMPENLPDIAVAVLVDQSGSMWGDRLESALKAAVLIDDFATGLGIPIMVSGHHTSSSVHGIDFHVYTQFDRVSKKPSYQLACMDADNCNRDGMAIHIAAELLSKRPEMIKFFIIISDGQPNDGNYGGEAAKEDIQSIVKKYKKYGVETIALAIGSDKDRIKEIYKDGYLDISDLKALPVTMTKLVSHKLMKMMM